MFRLDNKIAVVTGAGSGIGQAIATTFAKQGAGEVYVHLQHAYGIDWPGPVCGMPGSPYDHKPERKWGHLDNCRFTALFERVAIEWMKLASQHAAGEGPWDAEGDPACGD